MARTMSDAEIRRRKQVQGHLSQATGGLGLAALGGTLMSTKRGGKAVKGAFKAVGQTRPKALAPKTMGKHTAPILATGAGISGIGSFNFASYTGAESRKRKAGAVSKSEGVGLEMGYYGEIGTPVLPTEIEAPVSKAWTPSASNYNPEQKRNGRSRAYEGASLTAAGAGGAYAAMHGRETVRHARSAQGALKPKRVRTTDGKKIYINEKGAKMEPVIRAKPLLRSAKAARKAGGKTAAGLGVVGAGVGAQQVLRHKRKGSWQSY